MKFPVAAFLIAILVTCGFSQAGKSTNQAKPIIGTRVRLIPPPRFTPSPRFPGYQLEPLGSSIMVTELPGPFPEVSAGFSDPSALLKRGMSLLNKQEVKVNGQTGVLLKVKQNAFGTDYLKWIVIFGDEKETVMIAATFPNELQAELSEKMKASILSASWDKERNISPTEGLNFTFSQSGDLKLAKRLANSLLFTRSGRFPSKALEDPLFIIGQAISTVEVNDLEQFAKSRVFQTASVSDVEIEQSIKVTIDNLPGYEIVAKAKDNESGQPITIYQAMLFDGQSYFIMQGLIGGNQRQAYLKVFKEMAGSFKRKKS